MNSPKPNRDPTASARYQDVVALLGDIAAAAHGQSVIFRGEPKCFPHVSSGLYRATEEIEADAFQFSIAEQSILRDARQYARTVPVEDIFPLLQHFGFATNLVDFTTDVAVALFFACDGFPDEDGRIVICRTRSHELVVPKEPSNRVAAQKSIFVRPMNGIVDPFRIVSIPSRIKGSALEYLAHIHGILPSTIYNDLLGFIKHRSLHGTAYTAFYRGLSYASNGDWENAVSAYSESIKLNPFSFESYTNRGRVYTELEDYGSAMSDCDTALQLNPNSSYAYNNRGRIWAIQGDQDQAIDNYNRAIELDPSNAPAFSNRGLAYAEKLDFVSAKRDHDFAVELDSDSAAIRYNRAETLLQMGNWDQSQLDIQFARDIGFQVGAEFAKTFGSTEEFESRFGVQLPLGIAELVEGE